LAGWKLFHCFSLLPLAVAFYGLHRFIVPQIKRAAPRRREEAYICNPLADSRSMSTEVNQGVVADTAKLMMHRLIARQIRRDPTLVEKAKVAHARQAKTDGCRRHGGSRPRGLRTLSELRG
jgi:hypothetical protein